MARTKKTLFGSGEKPNNNLINSTDFTAPQTGYPITFGKGEWTDGIFVTIASYGIDDSKVRFVWDVDSTNSGAIYAGNKLVSSKILDITTNAENDVPATEVTVKFIDSDNTIQELSFGIVDPEHMSELELIVESLENWAKSTDTSIIKEKTDGALDVIPGNGTFSTYEIGVKVDDSQDSDVSILDDKITVSKYYILKLADQDTSTGFSAQYQLMVQKPGSNDFIPMGDTIDIFKDFFLKSAHVCTFDKKLNETTGEVTSWDDGEEASIDTGVYAIVTEEEFADASGWINQDDTHVDVLLEKAPQGKGLYVNHTYLHLIVNTAGDDEMAPEDGNDTLTDVYLDFTEILGNGAFAELDSQVQDIESRLNVIENAYVREITIPESEQDSLFKTITITSVSNTSTVTNSSFDIPDQAYYEQVAANFDILTNDCSTFANCLTWQDLGQ